MNDAVNFMSAYEITTVLLAVLINILTGLTKLPIKALANKLKDSTRITRFLVFMPIIYGFLLTVAYSAVMNNRIMFDGEFYRLWLSSSSLSLTLYAVFEKLLPTKEKLLSSDEIDANKRLIKEINTATGVDDHSADAEVTVKVNKHAPSKQHFILGRFNDEKTEDEK